MPRGSELVITSHIEVLEWSAKSNDQSSIEAEFMICTVDGNPRMEHRFYITVPIPDDGAIASIDRHIKDCIISTFAEILNTIRA